ncbi:MAG: LysR family transcriptional regulator [Novosphingobium sp.]|uniref:LysR family transcriptional regulator n=1 Tax=Novosphingobium sp. TaxID=1874826 RepID=UPI0012CADDAC|nr:LysR family transcriptional regulator [Novosphingobium sp.]MPS68452.1 LysR family transcriptional regulator [Novosphingobium sp.]
MEHVRLRHILAVARTGSFSRAAEEERITQPALSRSIAAFEQRHAVILFDRGRGGARPTPAGELVIEQARTLLAAADDLERSLRLYGTGDVGRVAFGLGPMLASLLLPDLGQALLRARPGLRIVTVTRPPEQLLPELLDDRIEMIVGNNWKMSHVPGTEKRDLGRVRLEVMVRAGHPLAGRTAVSTPDLDGYPTASAVELSSGGFGGRGGSFVCDNFHVLRDLVLRTDCVWLSSPAFVAGELEQGSLVRLAVSDLAPIDSEICMLLRRGRSRSPAALVVAAEIEAMLGRIERGNALSAA